MADRCLTHKKENVGSCMWCGKQLCRLCIVKQDGNVFYCEKCVTRLKVGGA